MKKLMIVLMGAAFVFSASAAFAAKSTCTVEAVDGSKVTLNCDKTDVKAGDKVTVSGAKKKLEGC